MSRLKIVIDRNNSKYSDNSPCIDIPIKQVVCKTTREMLYPSKDKLRQIYRKSFETTSDHDHQHYLTNHILTITSNQTNYHLDKFKKNIREINKRLNQQLIHKRKYKKSPDRIVFFTFFEQSQDKDLTHCHIILRIPIFFNYKEKINEMTSVIEKYLPPKFSVKLTKRNKKTTRNYTTKKTSTNNDNFEVF